MNVRKNGWLFGIAAGAALAIGGVALTTSVMAEPGKSDPKAAGKDKEMKHEAAKVGAAAPNFTLTDAMGKEQKLSAYTGQGKVVVLEWFNSECPFIVRHHQKYTTMADLAKKYEGKVQFLAINSGGPGKEGYGKDKAAIEKWKLTYPVLVDPDGAVGKLFGAKTTPHMFIVDTKGVLVYAGGIDNDQDDKLSGEKKINYVAQALDEVLAGKKVSTPETKAYGCGVKYAN